MEEFEEMKQTAFKHVFTPGRPWNVMAAPKGFNIFVEGKGLHITDMNGKTYIDYWGTVQGANLLGYGRREIVEAACQQMMKLNFTPTHDGCPPKIKAAEKLAEASPGSLSMVFFGNGGTESIETALKVSRKFHKNSGFPCKYKVIGPATYHGSTLGAMGAGSDFAFHWEEFEPLPPGFIHVAHPWCSRCAFGLKYPDCGIACGRQVEQVILDEKPETVSAFIDTPISSLNMVPPPEYWPMVRSICDKYGVLLIFDCIVTGLGRTGKMFASEHFNIVPDIMVVGKGLAGGYFPISAAVVKKEVAQKFEGGAKETLIHSYTFEGLPGACAAAVATLDIIEQEKIVERSSRLGKYLYEQLQSFYEHKIVGEIRGGLGLTATIELVKDRKAGKKFTPDENGKVCRMIKEKFMAKGLWGMFRNPLSICPSLTITKDEIDQIVKAFDETIGEIEKEMR